MTALLAATALAGCSGSDDDPSSDAKSGKSGKSADPSASPTVKADVQKPCKATIQADSVSGDWKDAQVRVSDDHAVYSAQAGDTRISVYSPIGDSTASVNLYVKDGQYSTPVGNDEGLDVDGKGRSATVDADLDDVGGGGSVHVSADFTCGKGGKG